MEKGAASIINSPWIKSGLRGQSLQYIRGTH